MSLRVRLALALLGTSAGKGDYDDGYAAALRDTGDTPAVTIPAHQLQRGDRVNLHGHWHTTGRVTLENQLPEGATVHIVLDNGTSDADLDAHQPVQVERDGSAER